MAFKGFNSDTLAAMEAQGVQVDQGEPTQDQVPAPPVEPPVKDDVTPDQTPDIDFKEPPKDSAQEPLEEEPVTDPVKDTEPEEPKVISKEEASNMSLEDVLQKSGFKQEDLVQRVIKDKGFSDDLITELKGKIDSEVVDSFVADYNTRVTKETPAKPVDDSSKKMQEMTDFIYNTVGGEDNFKTVAGVLKQNADKSLIDKINAKLRSDNKDVVSEGVKEAVSQYKKLTGRGGNFMEGDAGTTQNGNSDVFITKADYHTAMRSEKYKTDPVYAAKMDNMRLKSRKLDSQRTMPGQFFNTHEGRLYAV